MTKEKEFESVTVRIRTKYLNFANEQIESSRWRNVSHAFEYAMAHVMKDHPENVSNGDTHAH